MTEENSLINVDQTSYNLEEKWIKVAAKYFNINTDLIITDDNDKSNSEVNMLKAGLFGFVNEIMANEIKNSTAHRNTLYDEFFINTASFPESIYRFAKAYNVPISLAQPAHMRAVMSVRKKDLINSTLKTEIVSDQNIDLRTLKTYRITMDKTYPFTVGKFTFSTPYDVLITMKQTKSGDYAITARYDKSEPLFGGFSDNVSDSLKIYQDISEGETYVYIALDLYQVAITSTDFQVLTDSLSENLFYTVEYSDQLAGFNVLYTENGKSEYLKLYFNNTYQPADPTEKFAYYTFLDENKLQISFGSMLGGFKPAFNSTLTVQTFTSKGKEGNFTYSGSITYNFSNSATDFSALVVNVTPSTSSSGGKDRLTTEEEKQKIVNSLTTRDSLVMESDLKNFFSEINITNSLNGSSVEFIKRRDDILKRIYNAFLIMRDSEGKVLPANTAPVVKIPLKYFQDTNNGNDIEGYVIPEHSIFRYSSKTHSYELVQTGYSKEIAQELATDKDNLLYANPYLLKIDVDPVLTGTYYKLDVNEEYNLDYTYNNDMSDMSIILNSLKIQKNVNYDEDDMDADTYTFTIDVNTNVSANELDANSFIRVILLSETGKKYGYFDLTREISSDASATDSSSRYVGKISTDRKFSNGKLGLKDSLYDEDGDIIQNVFIDEKLIVKVGVLLADPKHEYKYGTLNSTETSYFTDSFPADMQGDYDINSYTLLTSVTTNRTVKLYKNLTNSMISTVKRYNNTSLPYERRDFLVEMVPLVSLDYFRNKHETVFSIVDAYIDTVEEVANKLENNTSVDLKFTNTRGPSKYFYLDTETTGDEVTYDLVGRTDILLDFEINLYEPATDDLDTSIKQFISDFLESCNEDGIVPISNLVRLLESSYPSIRYINFNGLSGKLADMLSNKHQRILRKDINLNNMSKQEIIEYVPEYINVKKNLVDSSFDVPSEDGTTTTKVNLWKRYVNSINITYTTNT